MPIEPLVDATFWNGIAILLATAGFFGLAAACWLGSFLVKRDGPLADLEIFSVVFGCAFLVCAVFSINHFAAVVNPPAVTVERLYQDQLETTRAAIAAGRIEKELER